MSSSPALLAAAAFDAGAGSPPNDASVRDKVIKTRDVVNVFIIAPSMQKDGRVVEIRQTAIERRCSNPKIDRTQKEGYRKVVQLLLSLAFQLTPADASVSPLV